MEDRKSLTRYDDFYGMLSDEVRMEAFKKAIFAKVKPGDVVVDLGAGTGILSFWAVEAGAKTVYAIEKSDAIELAKAVAQTNGISEKINFIKDNSKNVTLPEKVDVIISETLGCFAVDENIMEFIIDARNRFLKPNGTIIPEAIQICLAPVEASQIYKKLEFWDSIHGIDFSLAKEVFKKKLFVEEIKSNQFLAEPKLFAALDLYTEQDPYGGNVLYFAFEKNGTVHGIAGWFNVDLTDSISISTDPESPMTHWKQAYLNLSEPIEVIKNDLMELSIKLNPEKELSDNSIVSFDYRCTQRGNK
jgi:type I protein arginine methyltransferase